MLHQSALHLGGWARVEGRSSHAPYNSWNATILWPQGALVKHTRELYRAEGITNAAEPGNTTHSRLYVSQFKYLIDFEIYWSKGHCTFI